MGWDGIGGGNAQTLLPPNTTGFLSDLPTPVHSSRSAQLIYLPDHVISHLSNCQARIDGCMIPQLYSLDDQVTGPHRFSVLFVLSGTLFVISFMHSPNPQNGLDAARAASGIEYCNSIMPIHTRRRHHPRFGDASLVHANE
jgi:hypothetical protein